MSVPIQIENWKVSKKTDLADEETVFMVEDNGEVLFYAMEEEIPNLIEALFWQLLPKERSDLIVRLCAHIDADITDEEIIQDYERNT
jgi:hypothetical protein